MVDVAERIAALESAEVLRNPPRGGGVWEFPGEMPKVRWVFEAGLPDPGTFPIDDLSALTDDVLRHDAADGLQYGGVASNSILYGYEGLRDLIAGTDPGARRARGRPPVGDAHPWRGAGDQPRHARVPRRGRHHRGRGAHLGRRPQRRPQRGRRGHCDPDGRRRHGRRRAGAGDRASGRRRTLAEARVHDRDVQHTDGLEPVACAPASSSSGSPNGTASSCSRTTSTASCATTATRSPPCSRSTVRASSSRSTASARSSPRRCAWVGSPAIPRRSARSAWYAAISV